MSESINYLTFKHLSQIRSSEVIRDVDVKFGFDTEMFMERKKNVISCEKSTKKGHMLALKLYTLPT